jgi:hypothetical protein
MLIEAVDTPFICRWPEGSVRLIPGQPVELPDDRAARLLAKCPERVRRVAVASPAFLVGSKVFWRDGLGRTHGPETVLREFTDHQTGKPWLVLDRDGSQVEILASTVIDPAVTVEPATVQPVGPIQPLEVGWLVTCRDERGTLRRGSVVSMGCDSGRWTVTLSDGGTLPLSQVESVGVIDGSGKLVSAWTVREHGFDGNKRKEHE